MAFETTNTIRNNLKAKYQTTDIYGNNGIYQLACLEGPREDVDQTGRTLNPGIKDIYRR
jgi:hypothetical protein